MALHTEDVMNDETVEFLEDYAANLPGVFYESD